VKCPRCETTVLKAEQMNGLSIDACPDCQGLWVRRCDLEGVVGGLGDRDDSRPAARDDDRRLDRDDDDDFDGNRDQRQQGGKRKGGWLQNIGDMFGGD
jgi:Zn-finger nucleic acid-binding protein